MNLFPSVIPQCPSESRTSPSGRRLEFLLCIFSVSLRREGNPKKSRLQRGQEKRCGTTAPVLSPFSDNTNTNYMHQCDMTNKQKNLIK